MNSVAQRPCCCSFASEVLPLLNNLLENREMQLEVDLSRAAKINHNMLACNANMG